MRPITEIRTTFPDRERAEACAAHLVAARVAACVQIDGPVDSLYHWAGRDERATEWRCTCKTTPDRGERCVELIAASHPYGVPELLVSTVMAIDAYGAWVASTVAAPDGHDRGDQGR